MIVMESLNQHFKKKQSFRDFEAQMIQHEIDHFSGILIEPTEKSLFRFLQFISAAMW